MGASAERVMELHRQGKNALEIAKDRGCSPQYVYQILKKNGVRARPSHSARKRYAAVTAVSEGMTVRQVAEMYDVDPRTIYAWMKRMGVSTPRKVHEKADKPINIYLPATLDTRLRDYAGKSGESLSGLIRRCIAEGIDRRVAETA